MKLAEARKEITLFATAASNIISGFEDDERYELEELLRTTFARERELAEQHRWREARAIALLNGDRA